MKSLLNILKIINIKVKKIFWVLTLRAFLVILLMILINIFWGCFIFYQYVFLANQKQPEVPQKIIKFDYKSYQSVIEKTQLTQSQPEQPEQPDIVESIVEPTEE